MALIKQINDAHTAPTGNHTRNEVCMCVLVVFDRPFLRFVSTCSHVTLCRGACSGVAYMKAVTGGLDDGFKSLEACARVITRYPGSARFRCVLVDAA